MKCLNCGAELGNEAKFCTECGTKVEERKDIIYCENCGNPMSKGSLFCSECGTKVGDNSLEKEENKEKKDIPKCPNCNAELEVGSLFCTECGAKIEKSNKKKTTKKETKEDKKETKKIKEDEERKSENVHTATLIVSRKKSFKGCAVPFHVLLDGVKVGDLKNGASVSCEVEEGIHKVTISTIDKDTDQPIEVTKERNSIEILTVAKMGLVAAKADIVDIKFN